MAKEIAKLPEKVYAAKVVRKSRGVTGAGGLWTRLFGVFHRRNEASSAITRSSVSPYYAENYDWETEIWVGTVTWEREQ